MPHLVLSKVGHFFVCKVICKNNGGNHKIMLVTTVFLMFFFKSLLSLGLCFLVFRLSFEWSPFIVALIIFVFLRRNFGVLCFWRS